MTEQDKERCREEIVNRGWNRVGQIDPEPDILLWNKDEEVKIIYEDMDGRPCMCNAVVVHDFCGTTYFRATTGAAKGNRMSGVIAYKEIDKPLKDSAIDTFEPYETEHRVNDLKRWNKADLIKHIMHLEHNNNELYRHQTENTEVVHAHWEYDPNGMDWNMGAWRCSKCKERNNNIGGDEKINPLLFAGSSYCPSCGAKIDERVSK